MENNQDKSIFEFNIDEESKSNFSSISQWANINAIVGFSGLGISIIAFFVSMNKVSSLGVNSGGVAASGGLTLLIGLGIGLVLNIMLITAAANIKKGIGQADQGFFNLGLTKLATYFKIYGILMIIGISLVALFVLIAALMGASRGF